MFSAHDSNILPFMIAYNLTSPECLWDIYVKKYKPSKENGIDFSDMEKDTRCETAPKYASSFLWELTQNVKSNEYFVRTKFDGEVVSFCPQGKEVSEMYCPLDEFANFSNQHLILEDSIYNSTCGSVEF